MKTIPLASLALLAACSAALAADPKTIKVNADGSGDFKTVQAAVDSVPVKNTDPVVIAIAPGTYKERIRIRDRPFITLRGVDPKTTILTYDWNAKTVENGREVGTSNSFSTEVRATDFTAENITFENTAGDTGQALALSARGDRQIYRNCRMLGWQDTLLADGNARLYFVDCHIEGRVDFIFGNATAVFERCTIHSKNGGYITAASTEAGKTGYVFLDCKLTGDAVPFDYTTTNPASTQKSKPSGKALLGRPWRPNASVTFVRCEIGDHIDPRGWNNWGKVENEQTARYAEHGNTGPGADRSQRVPWAKELTKDEAERLTAKSILAGSDNWDPTAAR